ncbi:hypothetical protein BKA65DRAFT_537018 [Rhexocercosporidium sp. MPI-PUGE-AT-0058]|nr:hypothetical protein BKA65DRAFT_537018 [Rhexocercosporidium sp. MPI-PUGE-AT-0058]
MQRGEGFKVGGGCWSWELELELELELGSREKYVVSRNWQRPEGRKKDWQKTRGQVLERERQNRVGERQKAVVGGEGGAVVVRYGTVAGPRISIGEVELAGSDTVESERKARAREQESQRARGRVVKSRSALLTATVWQRRVATLLVGGDKRRETRHRTRQELAGRKLAAGWSIPYRNVLAQIIHWPTELGCVDMGWDRGMGIFIGCAPAHDHFLVEGQGRHWMPRKANGRKGAPARPGKQGREGQGGSRGKGTDLIPPACSLCGWSKRDRQQVWLRDATWWVMVQILDFHGVQYCTVQAPSL